MGTYLYTLRKKTIKANIMGEQTEANLFSYFSKPYWDWGGISDTPSKLAIGRTNALWEGKLLPKYVTSFDIGNLKNPKHPDIRQRLYSVYTNLKYCIWLDDDGIFPADHIGYLEIHSGKTHAFFTAEEYKNLFGFTWDYTQLCTCAVK